MTDPYIALCWENKGSFELLGESYSLADFGGILPAVGDLIPSIGVPAGKDRNVIANREVYVVQRRYFAIPPTEDYGATIYLLVQIRSAEEREANLIGS